VKGRAPEKGSPGEAKKSEKNTATGKPGSLEGDARAQSAATDRAVDGVDRKTGGSGEEAATTEPSKDELKAAEAPKVQDGFEVTNPNAPSAAKKLREAELEAQRLPLPQANTQGEGAIAALNNAQAPGVFFKEDDERSSNKREAQDEQEDEDERALREAVEEARQLLAEVKGVQRVGPGRSDTGERIIVISTERGFTDASMDAIPAAVRQFPTLVAVPFDLLPLRRERR
jgi:hypothetical protein